MSSDTESGSLLIVILLIIAAVWLIGALKHPYNDFLVFFKYQRGNIIHEARFKNSKDFYTYCGDSNKTLYKLGMSGLSDSCKTFVSRLDAFWENELRILHGDSFSNCYADFTRNIDKYDAFLKYINLHQTIVGTPTIYMYENFMKDSFAVPMMCSMSPTQQQMLEILYIGSKNNIGLSPVKQQENINITKRWRYDSATGKLVLVSDGKC